MPRKLVRVWSVSSPTTHGWTAFPSPACASATLKPSMPSASTIYTATASFRSTRPTATPAKRFSHCRANPPGIKVGTSITLLSKASVLESTNKRILYRDFHQARASERRQALLNSLEEPDIDSGYSPLECNLSLGLPFKPMAVSGRLAGLAGPARSVPEVVPGSENQPRRFPGRR